jgi:hypothetical protein
MERVNVAAGDTNVCLGPYKRGNHLLAVVDTECSPAGSKQERNTHRWGDKVLWHGV